MDRETVLSGGACLWQPSGPDHAKGTVIICPGGGYEWLSPREGEPVAEAFHKKGWATAVLYYTVKHWDGGDGLGLFPLTQLGEAVKLVREQTGDRPVIVCGFSAGGHLATSLGVHWKTLKLPKPDGLILCYPVITAGEYRHPGSILNLAGEGDTSFFSLERHVTDQMPPVFLWHTASDSQVPVQNSLLLAQAMAEVGIEFEMTIFPKGVHGLSLSTPQVEEPEKGRFADEHVAGWFGQCIDWLDLLIQNKKMDDIRRL